jgi:hypothetical protein
MPEEKNNSLPVTGTGGSDQTPEEALADKLAEQADAVTSELRDLLPDAPAARTQESHPEATVVGNATMSESGETRDATPTQDKSILAAGVPADQSAESAENVASETVVTSMPTAMDSGRTAEAPAAAAGVVAEPDGDDRLMSALAWLTMVILQLPIVSVIQLLSPTTKDRPFQRNHAITSLLFYVAAFVYEFVAVIVYAILGALTLGCGYACLWVIFFLPHALGLYYALQAYNGKTIELPVLSNFGRQQGWL